MDEEFLRNLQSALTGIDKRLKSVETQRINQQQILPLAVKQRHIQGNIIFSGTDANRPSDGSTEVQVYFATDTNKLYIWNGTAWKSATFT